jgi:hypothetical protein
MEQTLGQAARKPRPPEQGQAKSNLLVDRDGLLLDCHLRLLSINPRSKIFFRSSGELDLL